MPQHARSALPRVARLIAALLVLLLPCSTLYALERPDMEFKVFQFPADQIPRIDGRTDDWEIVPADYAYGTDQLADTVMGKGTRHDPRDLDVKVRVGWVRGENRLYFLYEASDDYWNLYYKRGDIFEVCVDGDLSGGPFIFNPQLPAGEQYFRFRGVHAQNYHIFTPPGPGRDWVFVWGCQPWIGRLPFANHAYSYSFKEGESGRLVLEFWITPFDYAPYDGPARAVPSKLEENGVIGLSWAVLDYDEDNHKYEGFWNLSHHTRMDSDASRLCAFRLMPLTAPFLPALEAEWSHQVPDPAGRTVAFRDRSRGEISAWLWDFDDSTTSTDRHPVHVYGKAGEYTVTLTVTGPRGSARRIKVGEVVVK